MLKIYTKPRNIHLSKIQITFISQIRFEKFDNYLLISIDICKDYLLKFLFHFFFQYQVIDNACATLAVLNIAFNNPQIEIGEDLKKFKEFTKDFPPPVNFLFFLLQSRIDSFC